MCGKGKPGPHTIPAGGRQCAVLGGRVKRGSHIAGPNVPLPKHPAARSADMWVGTAQGLYMGKKQVGSRSRVTVTVTAPPAPLHVPQPSQSEARTCGGRSDGRSRHLSSNGHSGSLACIRVAMASAVTCRWQEYIKYKTTRQAKRIIELCGLLRLFGDHSVLSNNNAAPQ